MEIASCDRAKIEIRELWQIPRDVIGHYNGKGGFEVQGVMAMKKSQMEWMQGMGCLVVLVVGVAGMGVTAMNKPMAQAGVAATGMATPSPALLVLNKSENALAIVDPTTLQVVAKVPTGAVPHEVAASADGKLAVATNYGQERSGTTLSVIDLVGQKEIHTVDISPLKSPHGIIATRDGKFIFTAEGSNTIANYDPAKNVAGGWTMPTSQNGTHMVAETKDGTQLFTANIGSNNVTVLELNAKSGKWSTTQIAVGKGPEGIDMSPDEKEVWAANSGDGTVSEIDTRSKRVTNTLDVHTKRANRLKFTPDGKMVLISDMGAGDLVVIDVATEKEVKRIHLGKSVEGILIQPDGTRAFVAVTPENKVAVVDLKMLEVVKTFTTGNEPDGMAWAVRK
jgi:YVTN family beta-propeller protein